MKHFSAIRSNGVWWPLGVPSLIPQGQEDIVNIEIKPGSSDHHHMVAKQRQNGPDLKNSAVAATKSRLMKMTELGSYIDKTLIFQSRQFGTRLNPIKSS